MQGGNCVGGSVDEIPGGHGTCEKGEIFFLIFFLVVRVIYWGWELFAELLI